MDDQKERALGDNETPDAIMEDDFDLKHFLGAMGRKTTTTTKRPPATRRRIEELGEQRDLRAVIADSWED